MLRLLNYTHLWLTINWTRIHWNTRKFEPHFTSSLTLLKKKEKIKKKKKKKKKKKEKQENKEGGGVGWGSCVDSDPSH